MILFNKEYFIDIPTPVGSTCHANSSSRLRLNSSYSETTFKAVKPRVYTFRYIDTSCPGFLFKRCKRTGNGDGV